MTDFRATTRFLRKIRRELYELTAESVIKSRNDTLSELASAQRHDEDTEDE